MRHTTRVRPAFAILLVATAALGCKVAGKNNRSDSTPEATIESNGPVKPYVSDFPPNGEVIKDYTELSGKAQLLSTAFPSGSPILSLNQGATDPAEGLALTSGVVTGSMLDSMAADFIQVRSRISNDVFLTTDKNGSTVVALYLNATVGYILPQTGDLASCSAVAVPLGTQLLPILDCVALGAPAAIIDSGAKYPNGSYVRSSSTVSYENGSTAVSGTTVYYSNGTTLRTGSSYYWADGSRMIQGSTTSYPDSTYMYNSYLRHLNGTRFTSDTQALYNDGSTIRSADGTLYYPNRNRLSTTEDKVYYPNGNLLSDASNGIYTEGGSPTSSVEFSRSFTLADVYASATKVAAWTGIVQKALRGNLETYAVSGKHIEW